MDELSTDLVLAVLQWLDSASDMEASQRVCRSWRRLLRCDEAKVRALWRAVYLRTWLPPLRALPTAGAAASVAGQEYEDEERMAKVNWSAECCQRARLERANDPQQQAIRLADVLRAAAAVALRDPQLYEAEADADDGTEEQEEDEEEEDEEEEEQEQETSEPMEMEKDEVGEAEGNLVPNAHYLVTGRRTKPKQLKKVEREIGAAKRLIDARSNFGFMRERTQTLLSSISMRRARGQEVHRLLSLLAKNTLYRSFDSFNGAHEGIEGPNTHNVSVVMHSLVTGLPLHLSWNYESQQEHTHTIVQASSACGAVSLHQESYSADPQRDDEQVAALLTFLFGAQHGQTVRPAEMEVFLRAALTPHGCSEELALGW